MKIGLCGFTLAIADYPRSFPVVEVQQTFYEPPADGVMKRWLAQTPKGFEFTIKAWQLVTHDGASPTYRRLRRPLSPDERASCGSFRDTDIVRVGLSRTLECARLLAATAVLFQCPASFRPTRENVERLRNFFRRNRPPPGVRWLWEPRGPAWTKEARLAQTLCAELQLGYVVDPFVDSPRPGVERPYFRLHGITGARHVYSDAELERLATMAPPDAYVMFNNIPRVADAERFKRLVRGTSENGRVITR